MMSPGQRATAQGYQGLEAANGAGEKEEGREAAVRGSQRREG